MDFLYAMFSTFYCDIITSRLDVWTHALILFLLGLISCKPFFKNNYFFPALTLSIFLYSQPAPSHAENRSLKSQDSGDRAEDHYWPHLGSIATAPAPLE